MGLESVKLRVVDPKEKSTFEGAALSLLKFYRRGDVGRWLHEGTGKSAKLKPPIEYKRRRRRGVPPTQAEINVDRAMARSKNG